MFEYIKNYICFWEIFNKTNPIEYHNPTNMTTIHPIHDSESENKEPLSHQPTKKQKYEPEPSDSYNKKLRYEMPLQEPQYEYQYQYQYEEYKESQHKEPQPQSQYKEEHESPFKILILGEPGVGKTSFIRALKEHILYEPQTFTESHYIPTKTTFTEYIPETNTNKILSSTVLEDIQNKKYSDEIGKFITKPHLYKEDRFLLLNKNDIIYCNIPENQPVNEVIISEYPSISKDNLFGFASKFDNIIIMGDYSDITTLRSIRYWLELIDAPSYKIIICINKCDTVPMNYFEDFQVRKARILKYFADKYKLEFISVKTSANLTFLYKHLSYDFEFDL